MRYAFVALIAVLWRLGGWDRSKWSGYRDVLVPVALGAYFAWNMGIWWLFPALAATYQIIRIGYGEPDPVGHPDPDPGSTLGWAFKRWTRAVAGVLYAAVGAAPLFIVTHDWEKYVYYIAVNAVVATVFRLFHNKALWIELAVGAGVGSIVLFQS